MSLRLLFRGYLFSDHGPFLFTTNRRNDDHSLTHISVTHPMTLNPGWDWESSVKRVKNWNPWFGWFTLHVTYIVDSVAENPLCCWSTRVLMMCQVERSPVRNRTPVLSHYMTWSILCYGYDEVKNTETEKKVQSVKPNAHFASLRAPIECVDIYNNFRGMQSEQLQKSSYFIEEMIIKCSWSIFVSILNRLVGISYRSGRSKTSGGRVNVFRMNLTLGS